MGGAGEGESGGGGAEEEDEVEKHRGGEVVIRRRLDLTMITRGSGFFVLAEWCLIFYTGDFGDVDKSFHGAASASSPRVASCASNFVVLWEDLHPMHCMC